MGQIVKNAETLRELKTGFKEDFKKVIDNVKSERDKKVKETEEKVKKKS